MDHDQVNTRISFAKVWQGVVTSATVQLRLGHTLSKNIFVIYNAKCFGQVDGNPHYWKKLRVVN